METSVTGGKLTLGMVTPILKLSKLQVRTVLVAARQKPVPEDRDVLDEADFRCLLVADLLMRLPFLEHEQRTVILAEVWALMSAPADQFAQLVFADGNYCTWTGKTGFLNLTTGETVETLPMLPVETIGYNLSVLYDRGRQQIAKRENRHAKKHPSGSVDQSGDVRDGSADAVS